MDLRGYSSVSDRRKAIEDNIGVSLASIGNYSINEELASSKNCENMIGVTQVPLGVAGPLKIQNSSIRQAQDRIQNYYVPLATTEGALVASVSRGCKAIALSGGATVVSKKIGITRAPVFVVKNILDGKKFVDWISANMNQLKEIAENTSTHLHLLEIKTTLMGRNVYLRFRFDSEDAMGMNMATIAVEKVADFIEKKTRVKCVAVSGNMCVDKKPNFLNFIEGRGYSLSAEVLIPKKVVQTILKTEIADLLEVYRRKIVYGSMLSGSIGSNAHFANILAAIFVATGQDVAHVGECCVGATTVEMIRDRLYVSVYLPDLVVGTVGGGTVLETQKEALSIMKVDGGNKGRNAQKLAEIIGGAVLAGEISLLASLTQNSLVLAHQRLGRGEK